MEMGIRDRCGRGHGKREEKKERQVRVEGEIYRQRLESTRATGERERDMERERKREMWSQEAVEVEEE